MNKIYTELMGYIKSIKVINTHAHHQEDYKYEGMNLEKIIKSTYLNWCGVSIDNTYHSKINFISKMKYNSYYVWLEKSIKETHNIDEPISIKTWDTIDTTIKSNYKEKKYHEYILKEKCKYEKIITDSFWNPGYNLDNKDLYKPAYRINMYLYGYNKQDRDHNGNNPFVKYKWKNINTLDDYIEKMREEIVKAVKSGCVALKSAIAYDRGLDFKVRSKIDAQKGFMNELATKEDIINFQDYIIFEICKIAEEINIHIQFHTGLANLDKSSSIWLKDIIQNNPLTKFVLFHGSYPWLDDLCAIVSTYSNVYVDICWLPIISISACERLVNELIEIGRSDNISWGCDTWIMEESYGALLAIRHILCKVLANKIECEYINLQDAKTLIYNIMYENANILYFS